ncbi:drug/metabolite exporter YedA [Flavobacterium noncentrifugens]|uniref:Permease of the drug/metabolite transporter (DMT) superfamily n=1 Tax=Flavobacterium noncentrifugens TaxID=1128970 RepID=A0A1G8W656_9FLAO|nr:EamA family transporter [Flavobacterium noncentrifugens]GEP50791.1 drug/metabolite exporter YedA [Flavobacterium noncentrifugens]SDJ73824.1 Permease of the drug/metabolite transporter (DMT) superfamily [Flavobacterium noncentrifugens]
MSFTKNKISIATLLAFASIYLIWGSTFLAISFGLEGFPPFILSGLRFFAAGLILFVWRKSKNEKSGTLFDWKKNAITGILILTGGTGLVAWGEQYVSSTEAAIAIASGPFWFIALDKKNWNNYFSNKAIVSGLIIGFAGLILFLKGSVSKSVHATDEGLKILAFIVLAISSVSWVLGSLYSKNNPGKQSTFMNISQQLIIAGIASFLIAGVRGEWIGFSLTVVPLASWLGLLFLIFFGSIAAYISYIWLLSTQDPVLVSTHTYINPIVAVFAGWIVTGEFISGIQFLGLGIILSGVVLTNASKYKLEKRTQVRIRKFNQVFARIVNPYNIQNPIKHA